MIDKQNLIISAEDSIFKSLEMLNNIENISNQILFVENKNKIILGSLTDGDIRRAIVKLKNLEIKVGEVCNRNYQYCFEDETIDYQKFKKNGIKILPILDKNKKLIKILDLDKYKAILPLECVIMAGGRGKRLSPITDKIPKPLLDLGGKPIIEHNIDNLIKYGVNKIYITINYLGHMIKDYFGDGSKKGINIEYVTEEKFYGTAGSISLINNVNSSSLIVMNSDLFTNVNFEKIYMESKKCNADIAISSIPYKVDIPYAIINSKNFDVKSFNEKPTYRYHSNAGIYIIKSEIIKKIPSNKKFDMTDLMDITLSENKRIIHVPITGYWVDIGKPVDYDRAKELIEFIKND